MHRFLYTLLALATLLIQQVFTSCKRGEDPAVPTTIYTIESGDGSINLPLVNWHVCGALPLAMDSVLTGSFTHLPSLTELDSLSYTADSCRYNGDYHPLYDQLDLKEVYGIAVTDSTKVLDSLVTYLSCTLKAKKAMDLFLYVRTEMSCKEYINGDTLAMMPFYDMEVYPIHLKQGDNILTVRTQGDGRTYWYEATLYDSLSMCKLYAEQHTGDIVHSIITNDSVHLTDRHWDMTDSPIKLLFHNVYGQKIAEIPLQKGTMDYPIQGMKDDHAYICSMIMGGNTIRQPVMSGSVEGAERKYKQLRDSIPDTHPRAAEIDQVLYRLWKLMSVTGKMREDRWYDFKFPWVIYQLEHTFAHLDGTYGNDDHEYNLKFITYRSKLDDGLQRYILVTPNTIDRSKEYPLIVVVRPCNEKRHHLFFSPQIAHQRVVNDMQAVANKYGTFVIMPEARMLLNEDMIPFAEAEIKLSIEDVQEHYCIDASRIFLHANCSGGYRALRLAERNPDLFAAIALYAPAYRRTDTDNVYMDGAPETMLEALQDIPICIFGDPADTHSPVSLYADLVTDCRTKKIPLQLVLCRNTGQGYQGYNRLLVGREACEFFRDKKKVSRRTKRDQANLPDSTIADFYAKPFIYVYHAADTSKVYRELVDNIRKEYGRYLYSRLPLFPDTRVTHKMLKEKNVFLIGEDFTCYPVRKLTEATKRDGSCPKGDSLVTLTVYDKPNDGEGKVLLYTSGKQKHFKHVINYPWKQGFQRSFTKTMERE